jgi:hypothetical protein
MADENKEKGVDKDELKEYAVVQDENAGKEEKKGKRKLWKIISYILAGVALLLVLLFIFRDVVIENCVRHVGSLVVGTPVQIASFDSSLNGTVELKGIKMGNPAGYQKPNLCEIDRIYVKLDTSTLLTDEPVVETVEVKGVRIDMEIKGAQKSNVSEIQQNVERFAGPAKKQEKEKEQPRKSEKNPVSPLIKNIALTEMQVSFSSSTFKSSVPVPLAPVYLKNVGGKGQPLGETLLKIFNGLGKSINAVGGTVMGGVELVGDAGKQIGSGVSKGISSAGEAGKKLGSDVTKGIKSIGGNLGGLFDKKK